MSGFTHFTHYEVTNPGVCVKTGLDLYFIEAVDNEGGRLIMADAYSPYGIAVYATDIAEEEGELPVIWTFQPRGFA